VETCRAVIVRFTRRAENDLAGSVDYLAAISPEGACGVAAGPRRVDPHYRGAPMRLPKDGETMRCVKIVLHHPYKIL
jgi:hypothetical protein